jgi:epoxyqueuosine reductase QueG
MDKKERMSQLVKEFLYNAGAMDVGIATLQTLAGGPPSTDLTYVLPEAKSAVCFAVPLEQSIIEKFLNKEDCRSHNIDNRRANTMASGMSLELATFLNMRGRPSRPLAANSCYRGEVPGGVYSELPDLSHRYLAVRSGLGYFGFSGNVIRPDVGAAFILGATVTSAELVPTDPLAPKENYCDQCKLCLAACASGLMSDTEETTVTMGGYDFTYSQRRAYSRCEYVCGGFAGLHSSGKWSTWSPARFTIPEKDDDFPPALLEAVDPYRNRPKQDFGFFHPLVPGSRIEFTCGHCQLLCHPDKEIRRKRFKMITENGVVVQHVDGALEAVTPKEAESHLSDMEPRRRALYEKV